MAVLGEPINEGGGEVIVLEKGSPFAEAQVGGDERGLFLVSLVHQSEEEPNLNGFDLDVAHLINQQHIHAQIAFDDLVFE